MTEDEMVGWHHQLDGHEFDKLQKLVKDRAAAHRVPNSTNEQLN